MSQLKRFQANTDTLQTLLQTFFGHEMDSIHTFLQIRKHAAIQREQEVTNTTGSGQDDWSLKKPRKR